MRLSDFLDPAFVVPRLSASDVEGILEEVAEAAAAAGLGDARTVKENLLERENQYPTVIGSGLAVPHATVPGLAAPTVGIALAPRGVPFGGSQLEPVRTLFVLLSPPGHEGHHVKLLARVCRLAGHPGFLDRLHAAADRDGIVAVIQTADQELT